MAAGRGRGPSPPVGFCDGIKPDWYEAQGDLTITIIAMDANFSRLTVDLEGGCGTAYPIYSKTYNGNTSDTGAPAPGIKFTWNPWTAKVDPCCYVMYVRIWDRTITDNYYSTGFGNENWQSITIA